MKNYSLSILFMALFLTVACDDGGKTKPTDDGGVDADVPEVTGYRCVRDPELVSQRVECGVDEHCPCGTNCSAGLCVHGCYYDSDCIDGWCDYFGRCRPMSDRRSIPGVTEGNPAVLQVTPRHLQAFDWSPPQEVRLIAVGGDLGQVRLVASTGLEVDCGDGFSSECVVDAVASDPEGVPVKARVVELPGLRPSVWFLTAHAGSQAVRVDVTRTDTSRWKDLVPGVYEGRIWTGQSAAELDSDLPFLPHELVAPTWGGSSLLTLTVFEDGTLLFQDSVGVLPADWVFRVGADGSSFDAVTGGTDHSRAVLFGGALDDTDVTSTEMTGSGSGELRFFTDMVRGTLEVRLAGLGLTWSPATLSDERPVLSFHFNALRSGDLPPGATPPALATSQPPAFAAMADRFEHPLPWSDELAACGEPTGVPTDLYSIMGGLLCYNHPSSSMDTVALRSFTMISELNAQGDLRCDDAAFRPTAFPLFTVGENPGGLTAGQLLNACLAELPRVHGPAPAPDGTGAACINRLSGCGSDGVCDASEMPRCIDGPVALRALAIGLEHSVVRLDHPHMTAYEVGSDPAARLALRILQQWFQVHAFTAREAGQQADPYLGRLDLAGLSGALDLSLDGWNLLLHPGVFSRVLHLPPRLLAEPDYRAGLVGGQMSLDKSQAVGLPVVILDTLNAQLAAATRIVSRIRFEGGVMPACVTRLQKTHAYLHAIAMLIHDKARLAGEPAWESLLQTALAANSQAGQALARELDALRLGRNPLGIDDADLPLYRGLTTTGVPSLRFAAISSFILDQFASDAIDAATAARTDADAAWDLLLTRQLQVAMAPDRTDRVNELKRMYGEKIIHLCGNPYNLRSDEVLDPARWPDLRAERCFLNPADSRCTISEDVFKANLSMDDLGHQMCLLNGLRTRLGQKANLSSASVNAMVDKMQTTLDDQYQNKGPLDYAPIPQNANEWFALFDADFAPALANTLTCDVSDPDCRLVKFMELQNVTQPTDADEMAFLDAKSVCDNIFGRGANMVRKIGSSCPKDLLDCHSGHIGALVFAAHSASKEVEVAVNTMNDFNRRYQHAIWKCTIDDRALVMSRQVTDQLETITTNMESIGKMNHKVVEWGETAINTVWAVGSALVSGNLSGLTEMGQGAGKNIYTLAKGKFLEYNDSVAGVGVLKGAHQKFMADFGSYIDDVKCYHDAEMHLIGAETQALRVEKAKLDLGAAMLGIRNAQAEADRLIREGRHRLEATEAADRSSLVSDLWQDLWTQTNADHKGKVEAYRQKMRVAHRMTWLLLRAVEYELQLTDAQRLALRSSVLRAKNPSELAAVADHLELLIAAGNIAGQPAENRHVEFSLKAHLLQLADRSDLKDGLHTMTPGERFQALLTSPRHAVHDKTTGAYRGQMIPFMIAPMGTLGLGQPGSISLLAGSECAERNWSVSVSLQGAGLDALPSAYTQVGVMQKNTFYSQKCVAAAGEELPIVSASVRPARNLFVDPVWGGNYGSAAPADSEYVVALVDAYHNVEWTEFQSPGYGAGGNETLACRGLYGEYGLFISAEKFDIGDASGLRLEDLEDIWIRLDYVSVAKQW